MSYFRNMRTTNERKAIEACEEEGVKVRAKRHNIPNAWDDISHARKGRDDRNKNHHRLSKVSKAS